MRIEFYISGEPKAQPRPRAFAKKFGATYSARIYDPGTAEGWKGLIAYWAKQHTPETPMDGPVRVDVDFFFPRPARLMRKKDPEGPIRHTAKPDRDNLDKALLDTLTQLGFWRDDAQVCDGAPRKWYVAKDGTPGARIVIEELNEDVDAPLLVSAMEDAFS